MYVLNDMSKDSRVIREATTLGGAGHHVTVMATGRSRDEASGTIERREGFEIVHIPVPAGRPIALMWVRRPWRLWRWAAHRWLAGMWAGPSGWPGATAMILGVILSLPWVVVRGAWHVIAFQLLGRSPRRTWLDYLAWWRHTILGWANLAVASAPEADVHHAHDMDALPAAAAASRRDGARLIYDSHEVFMAWGEHAAQPLPVRIVVGRWERRLARNAAALITVNDEIARELHRRLGVRRTIVVYNTPPRWTPPPTPRHLLRASADLRVDVPIVLCHGGFQANRGLEETALAMLEPGLERAHLVFLGYRPHVLEPILSDPRLAGRVHLIDSVSPADLLDWLVDADVDVMAILPVDLNHRLSSPNKLFESLAAGVPVVSSDLPVRRRIICEDPDGPLGALCDPTDPASIAAAIGAIVNAAPDERADLRRRCLAAAHARWNWETESPRLVALYGDLAAEPGRGQGSARATA